MQFENILGDKPTNMTGIPGLNPQYCVSQPEEIYRTGHEQMRDADLPEGCDWVEQNWVGPDGPTRVGGPNEQNIGQRDQMETS